MAATIPAIDVGPGSNLDYGFDLAPAATQLAKPWLGSGEQVVNLQVTADPGVTVTSPSVGPNALGTPGALVCAWLSGFVVGLSYFAHFTFTTNQGRTDTRSIQLRCVQR